MKIDLVCLTLNTAELGFRMYTSETLQQYIRRRIASLLIHHCSRHPEDCPGTLAESRYLAALNSKADSNLFEPIHFDNGEPIFTKENVVIIKANSTGSKSDLCLFLFYMYLYYRMYTSFYNYDGYSRYLFQVSPSR
jgi:hypothetical protein